MTVLSHHISIACFYNYGSLGDVRGLDRTLDKATIRGYGVWDHRPLRLFVCLGFTEGSVLLVVFFFFFGPVGGFLGVAFTMALSREVEESGVESKNAEGEGIVIVAIGIQ